MESNYQCKNCGNVKTLGQVTFRFKEDTFAFDI